MKFSWMYFDLGRKPKGQEHLPRIAAIPISAIVAREIGVSEGEAIFKIPER